MAVFLVHKPMGLLHSPMDKDFHLLIQQWALYNAKKYHRPNPDIPLDSRGKEGKDFVSKLEPKDSSELSR